MLPFDVEFKARLLEAGGQRGAERDPVCEPTCPGGKCTLRVGLALHRVEVGSSVKGEDDCESDWIALVAGTGCAGVDDCGGERRVEGTKADLIRIAIDAM